ncbi:MAG: DUF3800 domain-containing protein [Polyangiaceae bacterium]
MHICYLDESGSPSRNGGETSHFVMLGLAIPASTWRVKDAQISAILNAHNLFGELHTAWLVRTYPEQERIAKFETLSPTDRQAAVLRERKADLAKASMRGPKAVQTLARNYKKTNAFIHLTQRERMDVVCAVADLIGTWGDAVLFAEAQDKDAHSNTTADSHIVEIGFEQVASRYHHYLERGNVDAGILVQDKNETSERNLTRLARRFHKQGNAWASFARLVETPLFVDSELTAMVQLADLCSYATRRFFENGEADLLNRVYSRFDQYQGRYVGIRHYTGRRHCKCRVCKDHGRH